MNRKLLAVFLVAVAVVGVGLQVTSVQAQQDGAGNQPAATGLTVTDLTAPESVTPGDNVTVLATVSNPTDEQMSEIVEFRVAGAVVERQAVAVAPGESETVEFSLATDGIEPGTYVHGVFTETDGQVAELTLSESFVLESLDAPEEATSGEEITVNATVSNPNNETTTQDVEFRLAGALVESQSVTLDEDESAVVTFTVSTSGIEPGTYVHSVFTRDDGAFAEINITSEATPTETETGTEAPTETETGTEAPTETETGTETGTETETAS